VPGELIVLRPYEGKGGKRAEEEKEEEKAGSREQHLQPSFTGRKREKRVVHFLLIGQDGEGRKGKAVTRRKRKKEETNKRRSIKLERWVCWGGKEEKGGKQQH